MCAIIVLGPAVKLPNSLMYEIPVLMLKSNKLSFMKPDSLCTLPTLRHASHIVQGQQREFLCDVCKFTQTSYTCIKEISSAQFGLDYQTTLFLLHL